MDQALLRGLSRLPGVPGNQPGTHSIRKLIYGEPRFKAPALLRQLIAAGRLGRKTGSGFYRWEGEKRLEAELKALGRPVDLQVFPLPPQAPDLRALAGGNPLEALG